MKKLKVIKSTNPNSWYANNIGKIYCYKKIYSFDSKTKCFIVRNYKTILRTIKFEDAEVLNIK